MTTGKNHTTPYHNLVIRPLALAVALSFSQTVIALPCIVKNTLDYDLTTTPPSPATDSLRAAIECANNSAENTITFEIPTANPVITLTNQGDLLGFTPPLFSYLTIEKKLTITGPISGDPASVIIEGNNNRIFKSNASLTLENMTLRRGATSGPGSRGGAIYIYTDTPANAPLTLTLNNTLLTNNSTKTDSGGAIFATNAHVELNNSTVSSNSSNGSSGYVDGSGGGIYTGYGYDVTLNSSKVINNTASGPSSQGGGISSRGKVIINNSEVSGNKTTGNDSNGGGIYADGNVIISKNSTISGNSTLGDFSSGGGVFSNNKVTISDSTISGNTTGDPASALGKQSFGGGVFADGDYNTDEGISIENSTITSNHTYGERSAGGALYSPARIVILPGTTISKSSTRGNNSPGGGIATKEIISISDANIVDNLTVGDLSPGGGLFIKNNKYTSTIRQSTISGNATQGQNSPGGGLSANQSHFDIFNSTISGNRTEGINSYGGGVYATSVKLSQSTVSGNSLKDTSSLGGGIYVSGALGVPDNSGNTPIYEKPTEIIQSTITNNDHASDGAGGITIRALQNSTTINNSIISGNNLGNIDFSNTNNNSLTISFSHSLIGDPDSYFSGMTGTNVATQFDTLASLLPLSNNGGPTLTHLLDTNATNSAVDAGDNNLAPASFDQRGTGFPRVINNTVDIGATEANASPPPAIIPAVCTPD